MDLKTEYKIINIGNSNPIELRKLISLIEENLNKKAKIIAREPIPGDMERTYADIRTAKELLNYNPKVGIEEGIRLFCQWYVKNRASNNN